MVKNKILNVILCFLMLALGFCSHGVYDEMNNDRIINGLYLHNAKNITSASNYAYDRESNGDWVCINVAYDMSPELAYETCIHECSHKAYSEIYAEKCEEEPVKCLEFLNEK